MKQSIYFGLINSLVGIAIGVYVAQLAHGEGYQYFPIYAGVAAFLTTSVGWYFIIYRTRRFSRNLAIAIGLTSGALAHPVCFYIALIHCNIQYWFWRECSSLGEPPINLIFGLFTSFVPSIFSLIFFGWITIPLGAIIGFGFSYFLNKSS